jgi:hypothetical protein
MAGAPGVRPQRRAAIQTIKPGPYDTDFNDRIADTTYRWHHDSVNVTRENDIKAHFAEIMKGQFDPQEMISIIGADDGKYRNVWPPAIEDLVKQSRKPPCFGRSSTAKRRRGVQHIARSPHSDSRTRRPPRSGKEPCPMTSVPGIGFDCVNASVVVEVDR